MSTEEGKLQPTSVELQLRADYSPMTARDCVVFPGLPGSLILAGRQRGAATLLLEAPPALWRHLQPS